MEMLRMTQHETFAAPVRRERLPRAAYRGIAAERATAAEKVKKRHLPFDFSPMNSRERRIIHLALRSEPTVRSESAGIGPDRQVIVYPAGHASPPPGPAPARPFRRRAADADSCSFPIRSSRSPRLPAAAASASFASRVADARSIAERILRFRLDTSGSRGRRTSPTCSMRTGDVSTRSLRHFSRHRVRIPPKTSIEISCHGARSCCGFAWSGRFARAPVLAEPGEFTLRAYLNGRLDLPQAEAVRDLIDATTLYQARVAAQQVEGSVSRRIAPLKEQLARADFAARGRHRFRRRRYRRCAAGGDPAPARPDPRGCRATGAKLSPTANSCTTALRSPSSAGRMSARAACSIGCWSRIARS